MSATDDTYPADSTPTATPDQASHHPARAAAPLAGDHAPLTRGSVSPNACARILARPAWRNWIKPLRVSRLEDGTLTLEANSTLARERVTSQYADRLRVISAAEYGGVKKVEVRVAAQPRRACHSRSRRQSSLARRWAPGWTRDIPSPISSSASRTSWPSPSPADGRIRDGRLQPAVPLWRRRAWQDTSDARHRLAYPRTGPEPACRLSVGREIHVPVRPGASLP